MLLPQAGQAERAAALQTAQAGPAVKMPPVAQAAADLHAAARAPSLMWLLPAHQARQPFESPHPLQFCGAFLRTVQEEPCWREVPLAAAVSILWSHSHGMTRHLYVAAAVGWPSRPARGIACDKR